MSPRLRIFLVRHGQVAANREFRYVGQRDDALTEEGRHQAQGLATVLGGMGAEQVLASPRLRASETAKPIAKACGLELRVDDRLAEQSFGRWEGLTRSEVQALGPRDCDRLASCDQDPATRPPGGESLLDAQKRVVSLVEELLADGARSVILVSHVGPIKGLLGAALDLPLVLSRRLFLDPGTISVLDWGQPPLVRLFNAHSHLGWDNARWMLAPGVADVLRAVSATPDAISSSTSSG